MRAVAVLLVLLASVGGLINGLVIVGNTHPWWPALPYAIGGFVLLLAGLVWEAFSESEP